MYNKIDLAIFQEGEEGELKSENVWTKASGLLREALGHLAWAFSEKKTLLEKKTFVRNITFARKEDTSPAASCKNSFRRTCI